MPRPESITAAVLDWSDGSPVSRQYGDIYGSRQGWLEQAQAVFVVGNDLPARFAALPERGRLTVGEIGFGAGVNCLACVATFLAEAPADAHLTYLAFERYPLAPSDLRRMLEAFPVLGALRTELLSQWPVLLPGPHRIRLAGGRVRLTLWWADAADGLAACAAGRGVDAWFFDGFSPAKNPEAWDAALVQAAARHSTSTATAATWSVAAAVREAFAASGFVSEKRPGFGNKKEMLVARRSGATAAAGMRPGAIEIAGAGLSGCAAARSLAERGWSVTLCDPAGIAGGGASGNPQLLVQPMLMSVGTVRGDFARQAYAHAFPRLAASGYWHPCGTLWLGRAGSAEKMLRRLPSLAMPTAFARPVTGCEAAAIAGVPLPGIDRAVYSEVSGWVAPRGLCMALSAHAGIAVAERTATAPGIWAAGAHACCPWLAGDRGQVARLPMTPVSQSLRCALHFGHYLFPFDGMAHTLGATHGGDGLVWQAADQHELMTALAEHLPGLASGWPKEVTYPSRVGWRWQTADGVPVIGCDAAGLWHLTGLGARGVPQALLGAEVLADLMGNEPLCVPVAWLPSLSPLRFAALP